MFNAIREQGSSILYFKQRLKTGLKAEHVIHSKARATALSGALITPYACEQSAIIATGQFGKKPHYEAACAYMNYGTGRTVIFTPRDRFNRHALFANFGSDINNLNGCYIPALDSDIQSANIAITAEQQLFVSNTAAVNNFLPYKSLGELPCGQPRRKQ